AQLGANAGRSEERIKLEGADIMLGPNAADSIGLVVHELAANAATHGALTVPEGKVTVKWWLSGGANDGLITLDWREIGAPSAGRPEDAEFGRMLADKAIGLSLKG